jgi:carboxyl-terminal processing protease
LEGNNSKYKILQPAILALMVIIGMIGGFRLNEAGQGDFIRFFPGEQEISVGEVEEALRILENKYLYEPDDQALTDDALRQVFSRLDPFSIYISPDELPDVNDNMNGNYYGIGIETLILNDTLLVTNVLMNSPAMNAGLRKLDRLVALNGEPLTGESLDFPRFRAHFQQTKDTSYIQIFRRSNGEYLNFPIVSEKVETRSIKHQLRLDDTVLYIRIDQFNAKTYREFMEVLEENHIENKIPALILDLRNNPGGYLGEVTKILSQFFDESGRTLVRTTVRNGRERKYETTGRTFYHVGKILVLINENSASGSEVLAGALQDWDRALIIGRQSYGKGLVQEQYPLSNGGAVRLTVANYFLPSGRSIQHAFELDTAYFDADTVWAHAQMSYRSLLLERPLIGAQGIVPDITVADSLYDMLIYPEFYGSGTLSEMAINFIESNPTLLKIEEEDFFSNFVLEVPQEDRAFLNQVTEYRLPGEMINLLYKAKVAEYIFKDETVLRLLMEQDPMMKEALRQLEYKQWFQYDQLP